MANRLSKVVTRTGDDGSTALADGARVSKADRRVVALGEVDELNSVIGLLTAQALPEVLRAPLLSVQQHLFDLGGELASPRTPLVTPGHVAFLDALCEGLSAELAPLKEFILPGGCREGALCHFARAVCRRAERAVVALGAAEPVNPVLLAYLNRLSDALFMMARVLNKRHGAGETYWQPAGGGTARGAGENP